MRFLIGFLVDFFLILLAIVGALLLRENFEVPTERLLDAIPYVLATAMVAAFILPVSGLSRSIWRMSSMPDYLRVIVAIAAIVVVAVTLTFAFNRIEGIARSLPVLHAILAMSFLIGARVLMRLRYLARQIRKTPISPLKIVSDRPVETVLVVGMSHLTETYLLSIAELAPGRIKVVGLLGRSDRHIGRLVGLHKVLGLPEQVESVVSDLELHGIALDLIVVTTSIEALGPQARAALLLIDKSGLIELQYLSERLGLEGSTPSTTKSNTALQPHLSFEIAPDDLTIIGKRRYWKAKRLADAIGAALLITILSPVILFVGLLVAMTIGFPISFWQQRPGMGGRPFRLYKFRTMAAAYTPDCQPISDQARVSHIGNFLRRSHLDELPQLFNILRGHMSLVGPRPLLPRDQAEAYRARLLVRPGLTGWAQVVGGRDISAQNKAALDVWYVRNASFWLDLAVVARTVPIVLFGERTSQSLIKRAWNDLKDAGILQNDLKGLANEHMHTAILRKT